VSSDVSQIMTGVVEFRLFVSLCEAALFRIQAI
jgi:hypothetical protein